MDPDEPSSRPPAGPKDLSPMSVAELETYITGLEAEIARVRAAIASKKDVRSGAESLFRK